MGVTKLQQEHHPDAVRRRLENPRASYVGSAILGGIDGCVTTFAIVAAAVGGELSIVVIVVLGFANLIADGFSMAVSNYNASRSRVDEIARARRIENRHIDEVPEGEREEVRQILERKGLEGETLDRALGAITGDRRLWVDTMIAEEWGLPPRAPAPAAEAVVTFASFALAGLLPLLPFLVGVGDTAATFRTSVIVTAATFAGIGLTKGWVQGTPLWRSGLGTLLTGGTAAALAYASGSLLRSWFGA